MEPNHIPYEDNFVYAKYVETPIPIPSLGTIISPDYSDVNIEEPRTYYWRCPLDKQCVRYAEQKLGKQINLHAYQIIPNTKEPCINCGVLLYSPNPFGHIAVIQKVSEGSIEIIEQNQEGCGVISTRSIDLTDWIIRGFYK